MSSNEDETAGTGSASSPHDRHHAERRRARRDAAKAARGGGKDDDDQLYLYGIHTVRHALENPRRNKIRLLATKNALIRLELDPQLLASLAVEEALPRQLDQFVGPDAVHQGVVLETRPLVPARLGDLGKSNLLLVLDQVTDPHNVGAILRSAIAFDAGAVITTSRHSPAQSGVLAKAASGALDMIDLIEVRNLAEALEELSGLGYATIGLDSEGGAELERVAEGAAQGSGKIALVLGAEGKGLRQKTRATCSALARLDMPGAIKSLNVSNAATLSLYVARRALERGG